MKPILAYTAGVVTAPVWFYVFRKPLSKVLVPIVGDEQLNEPLYKFMSARNDYMDYKKKQNEQGEA